jgi:hypothetical protein
VLQYANRSLKLHPILVIVARQQQLHQQVATSLIRLFRPNSL